MFIYADESGHSGKHIFNEPFYYFQGAVISEVDTEPLLHSVAEKYREELGLERLHANDLKPHIVERIAASFLSILIDVNWIFHVTVIEKPYLSITKFVDILFDSFENKGARWLWYNHEFFRHTLCCLFDDVLLDENKKSFWESYLKDDYNGINSVVKIVLDRLEKVPLDKRIYQVSKEGLLFALKYPEEITLKASRTKKSYKGHTPNMVAFSSLIQAVHRFCKEHNLAPKAFIHDPQSEFGSTMREYHNLYSKVRAEHNESGLAPQAESVDYDLGKFSLTHSKHLSSLQAVDLFLWLTQRNDSINSVDLKETLSKFTDTFYISRISSEIIRTGWLHKLSNCDLTEEQIEEGKKEVKKVEDIHTQKLREFESKQLENKK